MIGRFFKTAVEPLERLADTAFSTVRQVQLFQRYRRKRLALWDTWMEVFDAFTAISCLALCRVSLFGLQRDGV
jgi:hypothetical protein